MKIAFSSCDVSLTKLSLSCGTGWQVRHLRVKRPNVAHRLPRGKRATCNGNQILSKATKFPATAYQKNHHKILIEVIMKKKSSSVWEGAMLLTAAALIVKLLSVVYRIPYQNMTGDFGFYVFQQAYPFYAIAAAIAFTGFPMALSKMIASENTVNDNLIKTSLWTTIVLGILSFFFLFISAPMIADFMGDTKLSLPIRVISALFLFIPLSAFFRGVYQGYGDMQLTAVSQLLEQTIRVSGILLISFYFVSNGFSSYVTGAGALSGSVLGSAAS
jgi:PST family polysaccharide transporter